MPATKNQPIPAEVSERVLTNVAMGWNGCVISTYSVASHGYAQVGWRDRTTKRTTMVTAHRAAWAGVHGQIPDDMTVHHRCHERRCVNVLHLELLTNEQNARRNRPGLDWIRDGSCVNGHGREHYLPIKHVDGKRRNRCTKCREVYDARKRQTPSA